MRDRLFALLKVSISAGLIAYLLLVKVDLSSVKDAIVGAHVGYLLLAFVLYFGAVTIGCTKWRLLLRAQGIEIALPRLMSFTLVGLFFGNLLLPLIAGDLVRGYDLARYTERSAEAAVSVLVDKLVGMLAFITAATLFSAYAVWGLGRTDLATLGVATFAAFLAFVIAFASMLSRRLRSLVERLFEIKLLAPVAPIYRKLSNALQAYRDKPGALARAFVISWSVLLITCVVNWLVVQSIDARIPFIYILLFNPMIAFAPVLIPSIGGLGVNQGAFDLFYVTVGHTTTSELAITLSLIMQLVIYVSSVPGGVLWLRKRRPARVRMDASERIVERTG